MINTKPCSEWIERILAILFGMRIARWQPSTQRVAGGLGAILFFSGLIGTVPAAEAWKVHEVYTGEHCNTCVAADFTGDGLPDIICNAGA